MNKSAELLKLVAANPELPIVPMVHYEIVGDDSYCYWLGSFGRCEVGEYALYKDRFYTDREELEETYGSDIANDHFDMSDEDFFNMVKEQTKDWWTKAIIVYIDTPD